MEWSLVDRLRDRCCCFSNCILKRGILIRLWFMESTAVSWPCKMPQKTHLRLQEDKTLLLLFVSLSPFHTIHSGFPSNLWACYGSLIWATASPPGHSAVTVEEAITALLLGLEMTRVTDDIRKSHSSLPNFGTATRWQSWQGVLLCCRHFHLGRKFLGAWTLQIKMFPAAIRDENKKKSLY